MPLRTFTRFSDRRDAGRQLAARLRHLAGQPDVFILGLPRGGVPVAFEVAKSLQQPLDVFVVRKLGVPGHEEFAMGAVASGNVRVLNGDVLRELHISRTTVDLVTANEQKELARRESAYRRGRPFPNLWGTTVVLVDDGIATGATMFAAIRAVRELKAEQIIVAAPVIAASTRTLLIAEADAVECVEAPENFLAVGAWYQSFEQTTDAEVQSLLSASASPARTSPASAGDSTSYATEETRTLHIPSPGGVLTGDLTVPRDANGLVIFAHGSGSSRLSPRNRDVAAALQRQGFATLLFDLLTPREEAVDRLTGEYRFDIPRLSTRLIAVTDWVAGRDDLHGLPIGYFGASTGAAAALRAAAARSDIVRAVVSRGGRPDLAGPALEHVAAPTLLIVGGLDREVFTLNRAARERMRQAGVDLYIVPGATHLFEEPGALDEVTRVAADWFREHLANAPAHMG
jgi:putative phosphoribosyl transferase